VQEIASTTLFLQKACWSRRLKN